MFYGKYFLREQNVEQAAETYMIKKSYYLLFIPFNGLFLMSLSIWVFHFKPILHTK